MSSSRGGCSLNGRFVALVFVVVVAAASAGVARPFGQTIRPSAEKAVCGVERWTVKTLQDRPRLLPVYRTTVRQLVRLPRPAYLPNTRLPIERHVYSVIASATLLREEDDEDFHVISPQRAVSHDLGIPERALLYAERYALPEGADAGGAVAPATVLRSRPGDRGRLL
jgi:hypothetical protein